MTLTISRYAMAFLMLILLSSFQALCQQDNNLTIYETPEEMVAEAKKVISEISVEDFMKICTCDDNIIIDVRTAEEYAAGAIPEAINIPRGVLEFRINDENIWKPAGLNVPEKDTRIFLYCRSGGRSALAAKSLMQLGYLNVKSVKGGWKDWNEAHSGIKE